MSGPAFRVGDAERDAAVSALGEHFAAGRLTKDEFDERSGRAWAARYADDLDGLFTDLPQPVAVRPEPAPAPQRRMRGPRSLPRLLLMAPVAMMAFGGLLFLIVWTAPWLLFVFGLLFLFGGPPWRRRHWQWHDGGGPRSGWGPPGWGPPGAGRSGRGWDRQGWDRRGWNGPSGPGAGRDWLPSSRDDRVAERRDWPPARPGWGPQPRDSWVSGR